MPLPALALPASVEAAVVVAGAMWLTLAPQIPAAMRHRGTLALLTWLGSRAALLALAHVHPASLALPLAADLVAWRALADADGDGGEAAWAWAATPVVALFMIRAVPAAALGAAAVALALACARRGWRLTAGLALGSAAAFGGPWAACAALPFALGGLRRPAELATIAVPVAAGLALAATHALGGPWITPLGLPAPGSGPTLWRLPAALGATAPAWAGWALVAAAAVVGAMRSARANAAPEAIGTWGCCVLAALAPGITGAHLLPWLPFVCAWCAGDPDRRGWWVIEGLLLPLALLLEAGPLQGTAGFTWRWLAWILVPGSAVLALWPLRAMSIPTIAPRAESAR